MESEGKKLRLHLGCGDTYLDGYTNVDFPQKEHTVMKPRVDVEGDFRNLQYEKNSVDEIRNHHVFEHFSRAEALKLLAQWREWLKPGGLLHIETPDFTTSAKKFLLGGLKTQMRLGRHIFGSHEARWAYHLDYWDKRKFRFVLKKLGFEKIRVIQYHNSVAKQIGRFSWFFNIVGNFLPESFYRSYGGNKLPNVVVFARKKDANVNYKEAIKEILSLCLVGKEAEQMISVWMKEAGF